MSIDFNGIINLSNLVSSTNNDVTKLETTQAEVNKLSDQKIFNMGSDTSGRAALEAQKKRLEAEITSLNEMIENLKNSISNNLALVKKYQGAMEEELAKIMDESEQLTEEQRTSVNKAQDEVVEMLKSGEITKDEFTSTLAKKMHILGIVSIAEEDLQARLEQNATYTQNLNALSIQINNASANLTQVQQQAALSTVSLNTINALLNTMTAPTELQKTYDSGNFIFSPSQVDLIDNLSQTYGKGTVTGAAQMAKLDEAIKAGILGQFQTAGMSTQQAASALSWMFDGVGLEYDATNGQLVVPAATGEEDAPTLTDVVNGFNEQFGTEDAPAAVQLQPPPLPVDNGEIANNPRPTARPAGDPIGFNKGDVTFDFVVDANKDNIFNGMEEFIGYTETDLSAITDDQVGTLFGEKFASLTVADLAKFDIDGDGKITGIEELLMYDSDNNGKIENDELNDLMILKTDWTTGSHSFTSAKLAGVKDIDLSMFQDGGAYSKDKINQMSWLDINNNLTQNRFNVNMNDSSRLGGYQRLDNDEYLQKAYGNAVDMQYTLDFELEKDENGNIKDIMIKNDSTASESARAAIISAKEALQEALAKLEAEKQQRAEDKAETVVEGIKAGAEADAEEIGNVDEEETTTEEAEVEDTNQITNEEETVETELEIEKEEEQLIED